MPTGWKSKAGFAKEGSWAVPATVTARYPLLSFPWSETPDDLAVPEVVADGGYKRVAGLSSYHSADLTGYLMQADSTDRPGLLLEAAMGRGVISGSNRYYILDSSQPPSLTLAVDDGDGSIIEYKGLKILEMVILGEVSRAISFSSRAAAVSENTSPTVNTSSDAWVPIVSEVAMFDDLTVEIDGTSRKITGFEIRYRGDWIVGPDVSSGVEIREPKRQRRSLELILSFPTGSDAIDGLIAARAAKSKVAVSISAVGSTNTTTFYLPACDVSRIDYYQFTDEKRIRPDAGFRACLPEEIPSGFPNYDSEMVIHRTV